MVIELLMIALGVINGIAEFDLTNIMIMKDRVNSNCNYG